VRQEEEENNGGSLPGGRGTVASGYSDKHIISFSCFKTFVIFISCTFYWDY
jgi:hypothetical protein